MLIDFGHSSRGCGHVTRFQPIETQEMVGIWPIGAQKMANSLEFRWQAFSMQTFN
jgi:hypothetical protein